MRTIGAKNPHPPKPPPPQQHTHTHRAWEVPFCSCLDNEIRFLFYVIYLVLNSREANRFPMLRAHLPTLYCVPRI